MKIAVIGATGTVGRAVFSEFQPRHEVVELAPRAVRTAST